MPRECLPWVQGVEGAPYRAERAAAEALQRGVQELRRHMVQEPFHDEPHTLDTPRTFSSDLLKEFYNASHIF